MNTSGLDLRHDCTLMRPLSCAFAAESGAGTTEPPPGGPWGLTPRSPFFDRCATGTGSAHMFEATLDFKFSAVPMPPIVFVLIFAIPILGILLAGYKEWLDHKAQRQTLGPTAEELHERFRALHERIDDLERERDALQERVQNLETIVTSEAWIADHDDATELGELPLPPDRESESQSETEHSAELARRLRNE